MCVCVCVSTRTVNTCIQSLEGKLPEHSDKLPTELRGSLIFTTSLSLSLSLSLCGSFLSSSHAIKPVSLVCVSLAPCRSKDDSFWHFPPIHNSSLHLHYKGRWLHRDTNYAFCSSLGNSFVFFPDKFAQSHASQPAL